VLLACAWKTTLSEEEFEMDEIAGLDCIFDKANTLTIDTKEDIIRLFNNEL
jgi:hypothetical protein